ncbi:MAG: right-handed parallel beta-helix repeat-containing protein [Dysgonamonadaceae bacterium]|jgi:hypothetical protein|nr:right-handed parallel beta-helix repeat-containing protein [Dysgonamonadaceae bacterium]
MKTSILSLSLFVLTVCTPSAQNFSSPADEMPRGYFDQPYLRYEAEDGKCETNGTFLQPTYDQRELQSEASNQSAVQLIAKNAYIQWTNAEAADGLTIRFSLPDNAEGAGTKGTLALYVNNAFVQNITLDSFWAWQYFLKTMSNPYPDNTPATNKFPRMRFDEMHVRLANKILAGATFKLVKTDDNDAPYTIDFVELEEVPPMVTFASISDANKVEYTPDKGSLYNFIATNGGKTIYIPAGKYESEFRITINGNNTKLIGAGMWYTEIYFTTSSDERATYSRRGIESSSSNIVIDGLFLNTVNNKRYYENNDAYQVGKGLMGSFGSNSVIRNVWATHFECGAWIDGTSNLLVAHCRFRDNYADGINLSYGSKNSVVEHCSFRNNGDDDIATWSRADRFCENNVFRFCTAENNWRASSLGFFGGKQNKAHNILIIDPMEAGFRVTCDFPGRPFSDDGFSEFYNISAYRGGVASGTIGVGGDLWGNQQGALHINSSSQYDLQNIKIYNVDLYDSKNDAVFIGSTSKSIKNLKLRDIRINKTGRYGLFFNNSKGSASYCNIQYENIGAATNFNTPPSSFTFTEDCTTAISSINPQSLKVVSLPGSLQISGSSKIFVYDLLGIKWHEASDLQGETTVDHLKAGIYVVRSGDTQETMKVAVK